MKICMDNSEHLINDYMPLIKANARVFGRFEYEEVIDESKMILLDAISEYDESKGTFGNFLKLKLRFHYLDKSKGEVVYSLDDKDPKGDAIIDSIASDIDIEEQIIKDERYEELYSAVESLPIKDRRIIMYKYFDKMSNNDIARLMGISYKTVANRSSIAIAELRSRLEKDME